MKLVSLVVVLGYLICQLQLRMIKEVIMFIVNPAEMSDISWPTGNFNFATNRMQDACLLK